MTDLTEKWKAGELEDGFYYTQTGKDRIISIDMYDKESNTWLLNSDKDMPPFEILASVPTYYEFDALKMNCEFIHRCLDGSRKKNTKLVKLLKECLPIVSAEIMTWQIRGGEESHKRGQNLLTRINAALGGSEER